MQRSARLFLLTLVFAISCEESPTPKIILSSAEAVMVTARSDSAGFTSRVLICGVQQATVGFYGEQQVEYLESRYATYGITFVQVVDSTNAMLTLVANKPVSLWVGEYYSIKYWPVPSHAVDLRELLNISPGWKSQGPIRADGVLNWYGGPEPRKSGDGQYCKH